MQKLVLAGLGLLAFAGASVAFAQGDVIAERRAGLKRMGEYMTQMKPVAEAGGDGRQFTGRIEEMVGFYQKLPGLFPAGSDKGDTKALPAVWSEHAGFAAADQDMVVKLQALHTAATSGDGAAFKGAWQAVGPACGGCHRNYRAR